MQELASFHNIHKGSDVVVCGCGESLNDLRNPERFVTIGVNDVGRKFHPNYLVVVNARDQFSGDRFRYVEASQAEYLFTHLELGLARPNVVKFRLGTFGGVDFTNLDVLHYTQNSPYVALCLAAHLGASRIGLIGVDFTDHHFFGPTGAHPLTARLATIDMQYRKLGAALRARGVEVVNLSRFSRLTAFPRMSLEEFTANAPAGSAHEPDAPLRIVSYATTPMVGVPAILARLIGRHTAHDARCVWAQSGYGNGVAFEGDIEWTQAPEEARAVLAGADAVIVHNGKVAPEHRALLAGKSVVTMAHNYRSNVDTAFVEQGYPGVVVGQYQATLPEFAGWTAVPNPVPLDDAAFQSGTKGRTVTICYTPAVKHERYPPGHSLYWHAKGYQTTMRVLDRLAACYPLQLEVIRDRQVVHAESLAMKRRAHIVIDECVTGSYHRNSLEGLATGCVVINGIGILPGVAEVFLHCAGDAETVPFVAATLETLESVLIGLIERGTEALAAEGARNRVWMERHWNFADQWSRFWTPALARARECAGAGRKTAVSITSTPCRVHARGEPSIANAGPPNAVRPALDGRGSRATESHAGLSVVIPHGGKERRSLLLATLRNVRQCRSVGEIILVEMAETQDVEDLAAEWADRYVFLRKGEVFHKARVLNMGTGLATQDLILWLDNDLLFSAEFLDRAIAELRERRLDCLIPWTSTGYLSEADTTAVLNGGRCPEACAPVTTYYSRRGTCGAAVLVRRVFTERYGGLCEEFRGWGGEDNGWFVKAQLLGRAAITERNDQHLRHLYHPLSGGYGSRDHIAANPHYSENVALLRAMRAIKDPTEFLRRFPPAEMLCAQAPRRPNSEGKTAPSLSTNPLDGAVGVTAAFLPHNLLFSDYGEASAMTYAKNSDLCLPEYSAFNFGRKQSRMRQWELPFSLFQLRLDSTHSVLDCTINPENFATPLRQLFPTTLYHHVCPIQNGAFVPLVGAPDNAFDRAVCVNTLEHLLESQREMLLAEIALKLKPGGLLVVTCDVYDDDFWQRPEILSMGVMRADRQEVFNGWNKVTPAELVSRCAAHGLHAAGELPSESQEGEADLYRNIALYPHACFGAVFHKSESLIPSPGKKIVLSLLTWNTRDISMESLQAYVREASMLRRLGHDPLIVVCDNGSNDGTREALCALEGKIPVPHQLILNDHNRGSSIARNQIIDLMLREQADYLLFLDGDIEIVPFSSMAMLRRMEEAGHRLGWLGADSAGWTARRENATRYLFSLADCRLENVNLVAWTQYGLFRREVFESGVRFDEAEPFDREGWGFEDNDLAFQMVVKGFVNQRFFGMTYLHRDPHSSMRVMRRSGIDPVSHYENRRRYVLQKWANTATIDIGLLNDMRRASCPKC